MTNIRILIVGAAAVLLALSQSAAIGQLPRNRRDLPKPLAQHPGNVFVAGEEVTVPLPKDGSRWSLVDYDGHRFGEALQRDGEAILGRLDVGFYRLEQAGGSNWISVGVLAPLREPTPSASPIGIDVAMAWFYPKEKMDAVASLCALAGVNWVRDRLNWAEMEPQQGRFAPANKYDTSASVQARAGLRVLQVIHASPGWANPNGKRFPLDLRDAYRFFETMAQRWQGQVLAFEPWNEADIPMFGGHTGAEMAALQKAAYLGLKAGNPKIVACLNVFALHKTNQLSDLYDNEAWPYTDTYNFHHYEPFDNYPKLYSDHRAISAGRPIWVSECAVPVTWAGDEKLKEPSDADLRVQAERVAKVFACSLHERSAATFYFLLPHYAEGQTQFGILRPDLTPRPAFVALAATARLLADAKPLGRLRTDDGAVRALLFGAKPDGSESDVLVAWATKGETKLNLPLAPRQLFDHLGRSLASVRELRLGVAPVFGLFASGSARQLSSTPPSKQPLMLRGKPSLVVLQALWPADKIDLALSAYRVRSEIPVQIPVFAYNFGSKAVRGQLHATATDGWTVQFPDALELAPHERRELTLIAEAATTPAKLPFSVRVRGDFGPAGKPVLSLRLVEEKPAK